MRTMTNPSVFAGVSLAVALLALAAADSRAASGPEYRSLRAHSMGNAFVAVVDNKDALYYNPAGLNLINALGNAAARPGLAAYPRNRLNARVNLVGASAPLTEMNDFFDVFKDHEEAFTGGESGFRRGGNAMINALNPLDRRAVELGVMHGAEFAMHNYGAAYWLDASVAPYADVGILLPQAGVETIQLDAVLQVATARGFLNNRLAAGAGYRLANRQTERDFHVASAEFAEDNGQPVIDRVQNKLDSMFSNMSDFSTYGHGIDLGVLWQQTPWLRLGASMQNLGMYLESEYVTPELTVGAAVSPPILSSGGKFPRKTNLAVDFEDLLNDDRNYKLFSKVNFGAEVEQYLWWFASARVAGGYKGGYWTAGGGLSLFTAVHIEDRYWALRVGVGL
jgi:hypothetical protein